MADRKISAFTELSGLPASGDILPILDISDVGDTNKKITVANLLMGKIVFHGIESGFVSLSITGDVLTVGAATNKYWYQGVPFTTTGAITCDLASTDSRDGSDDAKATNKLYYIYFKDETGTLYWSQQAWNLATKVPVATAYYNGSAWALGRETHGYMCNRSWHEYAHKTIGARFASGLDKTLPTSGTPQTLTLTSGTIFDEDLEINISQQTTARAWYQASNGVYTFEDIALPYLGTAGAPKFLDTDTYTLATFLTARYACYWVYASSDVDRPIYIIPTQAADAYTTIAAARAETAPNLTGLGLNPEMKLLYRWIYNGNGAFQESSDYRTSSSLPSGIVASTTATAVSFSPSGDISSNTVQTAIEELDTEKIAKSIYDANSILVANTDNTPEALTMAASTILSRLASGGIVAATLDQVLGLGSRFGIISATRDLSAASANGVAYTGMGFKPSALIAMCTVNTTRIMSFGMFAGSTGRGFADSATIVADSYAVSNFLILVYGATVNDYQYCTVPSLDNDGFTLNWVKAGTTISGTLNMYFLGLR